eukprot:1158433-Pelagomonas_calceolata.AAC.11
MGMKRFEAIPPVSYSAVHLHFMQRACSKRWLTDGQCSTFLKRSYLSNSSIQGRLRTSNFSHMGFIFALPGAGETRTSSSPSTLAGMLPPGLPSCPDTSMGMLPWPPPPLLSSWPIVHTCPSAVAIAAWRLPAMEVTCGYINISTTSKTNCHHSRSSTFYGHLAAAIAAWWLPL